MRAWKLLDHPPFNPPKLVSNSHIQTIVSSLRIASLGPSPDRSHEVPLGDEDRALVIENRPESWQAGDHIVLLIHGLSGCHHSAYMSRLAHTLQGEGALVLRMNLRGNRPGLSLAKGIYHSGQSDDCLEVLRYFNRIYPDSKICMVGFSLGGNIALKLAGEMKEKLSDFCSGVVAVSPPIDLAACSKKISRPENRFYDQYFVRRLVNHVTELELKYSRQPRTEFPDEMTLLKFDEVYTSVKNGFRSALDYYTKSSSGPLLKNITVKTLLVTAQDDPIIDYRSFLHYERSGMVKLALTDQGGHTGFMRVVGTKRTYWVDSLLCAFLNQLSHDW